MSTGRLAGVSLKSFTHRTTRQAWNASQATSTLLGVIAKSQLIDSIPTVAPHRNPYTTMAAPLYQDRPNNSNSNNNDDDRHDNDNDDDGDDDDDDDDDDPNRMTRAEAMAATRTMGDHERQARPHHATAAERAIMGTIDPDENVADFIFQDENGQLVQQRFLQFLNN